MKVDQQRAGAARRVLAAGVASLAALIANACGSDSGSSADGCAPQSTRECIGPAACKGGQVCGSDRAWSACDCGGGSGGISGAGGTSTAGGAGGTSAAGGTTGTGASNSGGAGGTSGGGGAPSGGSGGDASVGGSGGDAGSDAPSDVIDTGVGPYDDPCPVGPLHVDCSGSCAGESPGCGTSCYTMITPITDKTAAKYFVVRTPSTPGTLSACSCCCNGDAGPQPAYWMRIYFQGVNPGGYRITVGKPWRVWAKNDILGTGIGACLSEKYGNGCSWTSYSGSPANYAFYVGTDDPNAPARNVVIENVVGGWCTAADFWQ